MPEIGKPALLLEFLIESFCFWHHCVRKLFLLLYHQLPLILLKSMVRHSVCLYLPLLGQSLHIIHLDILPLPNDLGLHLVIVLVPFLYFQELPHVLIGRGMKVSEVALQEVTVD